jgi:hypothetical protein
MTAQESSREPASPSCPDEQDAPARIWIEVPKPHALVVDEKDRERKDEDRRVRHFEEAALAAIRDPPGGIRERRVGDQGEAEFPQSEEHREGERVVAVPQLPCEQREAGGDHERSEPVAWPF